MFPGCNAKLVAAFHTIVVFSPWRLFAQLVQKSTARSVDKNAKKIKKIPTTHLPNEQLFGGKLIIEDGNSVLVGGCQTRSSTNQSFAQRYIAFHVRKEQCWKPKNVTNSDNSSESKAKNLRVFPSISGSLMGYWGIHSRKRANSAPAASRPPLAAKWRGF